MCPGKPWLSDATGESHFGSKIHMKNFGSKIHMKKMDMERVAALAAQHVRRQSARPAVTLKPGPKAEWHKMRRANAKARFGYNYDLCYEEPSPDGEGPFFESTAGQGAASTAAAEPQQIGSTRCSASTNAGGDASSPKGSDAGEFEKLGDS